MYFEGAFINDITCLERVDNFASMETKKCGNEKMGCRNLTKIVVIYLKKYEKKKNFETPQMTLLLRREKGTYFSISDWHSGNSGYITNNSWVMQISH